MNMEIHFKESSWYRVEIQEGKENEVKALFKEGEIQYPSDIINRELHSNSNPIDDTIEQLDVLDNDGSPTIEIMEENEDGHLEITITNEDPHTHSRADWLQVVTSLESTIDKAIRLLPKKDINQEVLEILEKEQAARQGRENWR